ncbi:MAG: 3-5 exoribonuclease [Bacillota bacterium]|jgi:3'-5' exoribonuclease|nr:3-5 exoribonuclease [Bacillota bacterium]
MAKGVKRQFTARLKPGDEVEDYFVAAEPVLRPFRNGSGRSGSFLRLLLKDREGALPAVLWEGAEMVYPKLGGNPVVKVRGSVNRYQGELQVVLEAITPTEEELDPAYFLPCSPRPREEMEAELAARLAEVRLVPLSELLAAFFGDPTFFAAFTRAPAAKSIHHAYVGGLLEHTLETVHFAATIAARYPAYINRDLLLTGAFLHDCGKIIEYRIEGLAFTVSDAGRLFGHLVLGARMVEERIASCSNFPPNLKEELLHMILAHHGSEEWGSPQPPKTINAYALHLADYLSAEMNHFEGLIRAAGGTEGWTAVDKKLERSVYLGFLGNDEVAAGREGSSS